MPTVSSKSSISRAAIEEALEVKGGCHGAVECAIGDALLPVVLLLVVVGVPVVILVFAHLRSAQSTVDRERTETEAERDAYARFARRVADLDVASGIRPTTEVGGGSRLATTGPATERTAGAGANAKPGLDSVIEAYRETVMAVGGRTTASDREVVEDMAAEFGPEVATTVDSHQTLTPEVRRVVVGQAQTAATQRDDLLARLDREAAALETSDQEFADIVAQTPPDVTALAKMPDASLFDARETLLDLETRCESHLAERQARIHEESVTPVSREDGGDMFLQEYLYEPMEVTFPVLATGADLLERLEAARDRVEAAIVGR